MPKHTREETRELVAAVLAGDEEASRLFYKQYYRAVGDVVKKYVYRIQKKTFGLYEFDDITQEVWLFLWEKLPKYDWTKSNVMTWLYLMGNSRCSKIVRYYEAKHRQPEKDIKSIHMPYDFGGDNDKLELIDMIVDPSFAFEQAVLEERLLFSYLYLLRKVIESLSNTEKVTYRLMVQGDMTQSRIAGFLGLSQVQISRIEKKIIEQALEIWNRMEDVDVDLKKADKFGIALLGPESDDSLSDRLNCDLAVIKICREILIIVDLYERKDA